MTQGFLRHEPCLWHGTLYCIHQQQYRIHHRQHPLHFSAKICVARGVNDVDAPFSPADSGVFRKDRNAALSLQIIGVHHTLPHLSM